MHLLISKVVNLLPLHSKTVNAVHVLTSKVVNEQAE